MKNLWVQFIYGYAKMRIDGKYAERFLNRCIENQITIWHIQRITQERMICYIALRDINKIRKLLKMTNCHVTFIGRYGLPFLMKKIRTRTGFIVGLAAFLFLILTLSNIVWNIEIEGASPEIEHQLQKAITDLGIKKGKFLFLLPSVEEIQKQVTDKVENATWIGVRLNGTTLEFEVVEQTLPEKQELLSPRHLVAKKKAVIYDLFVEQGQPIVKPNDFVREGDLLVSGFIGKEGQIETVPAKGKVYGEIWYTSNVSIPLTSLFETLTGERIKRHYLTFYSFDVPIWGFKNHSYDSFEQIEKNYRIKIFKWELPVEYKYVEWLEKEEIKREYKEEEAISIAKEMARQELLKKVPKDAKIKGEKILHESIDNGKVELKIHYQVIENIAIEQPIIQGD